MSKQTLCSRALTIGLLGGLGVFGLAGCFTGDPHFERECDPDLDRECKPGFRCVDGEHKCYQECGTSEACPLDDQSCRDGICVQTTASTCAADPECPEGWTCNDGSCGKRRALGNGCGRPEQCWSGYCVDGVCCDGACDGSCQSCLAVQRGRTQGDGACGNTALGLDPDEECTGATACDGNGACLPPKAMGDSCAQGYECVSGLCTDGVCWSVTTFRVGGTVSGFPGGELHLSLNGTGLLTVTADGAFSFAEGLLDGSGYVVTVVDEPRGWLCTVGNNAGTVAGSDVTNVVLTCTAAPTYLVGGTASGIPASGVELVLNGADVLAVAADGSFAFADGFLDGDDYAVTLKDQPAGWVCAIVNGVGTVSGADASDVSVSCTLRSTSLASLALSLPQDLTPRFDPGTTFYRGDVSLLVQTVSVQPTAADVSSTVIVRVNGVVVPSTVPAQQTDLSLGKNLIEVEVTAAGGDSQIYSVLVDRGAAALAQRAYAKASNTDAGDGFGGSIALSIALSGDTLAVGAPYEASGAKGINSPDQADNSAVGSGAVYVFRRHGTEWVQEAFIKASNTDERDNFGISVALSGDTLAVGAYGESSDGIGGDQTNNAAPGAGAVYAFRRSGTTWVQEAYLKASNAEKYDQFGASVALIGDTLAVGAPWEKGNRVDGQTNNSVSEAGAVYVFQRSGSVWTQEAYVKAWYPGREDCFGTSLALTRNTLAVGSPGEASCATGINSEYESNDGCVGAGAAYVFRRSGSVWTQKAYIKASNTDRNDNFGISVALSEDTLAVGARYESSASSSNEADNTAGKSGAAYVFREVNGGWAQEAYLKASTIETGDIFGYSVALSGEALAVGAPGEDSSATGIGGSETDNSAAMSGAVYLFKRVGTAWTQQAYIKASNAEGSSTGLGDYFGYNVALSEDTLAVHARWEDSSAKGINGNQSDNSAVDSGAVYIFH